MTDSYYVHPTAVIDEGAQIGAGTKIWHFVHVMAGAQIGQGCVIGQGCFVGNVRIGNHVRIQNHVSVYDGVTLEDHVFVGPSCVFTNVINPRAEVSRKHEYQQTLVQQGASLGANSTIVCGAVIGQYAFVGAGAVVRRDVEDHALVVGVPAQQIGWMCACGVRIYQADDELFTCASCGTKYELVNQIMTPLGRL